ncbi:MAG: glutathione S-transferase [Pseudomonadales bacterium]|nr:glutathione S-transferase [Pseudomonadales bacterium]
MNNQPILYTFRRCPYAIRARMGLAYANVDFEHREVTLKNKPTNMISLSPKGTVPVLKLLDGTVLEESLDILIWAIGQKDVDGWMTYPAKRLSEMAALIAENDFEFKIHLDHYKYADRFPEASQEEYRSRCEPFLLSLEKRLTENPFLFSHQIAYADIAIVSFIRQFSKVDETWFSHAPYPRLKIWLNHLINSTLFLSIMKKYKAWQPGDAPIQS